MFFTSMSVHFVPPPSAWREKFSSTCLTAIQSSETETGTQSNHSSLLGKRAARATGRSRRVAGPEAGGFDGDGDSLKREDRLLPGPNSSRPRQATLTDCSRDLTEAINPRTK